jgi:hypothetical protein
MHYPRQWVAVQYVLAFIAILAFFVLLWSLWGLVNAERKVETLEDKEGRTYHRYRRVRKFRAKSTITSIIIILIAGFIIGVTGAIQEYIGLTGKILVAHVRAIPVKNQGNIPVMSVDLTLYDDNGNKSSEDVYIVNGDEVFIGGDVIQLRGWLNILGFHSGYKLTKLEGMYSDVNLERTQQHTVVVLNGGDDDLFNTAYHNGWNTIFVTAAYKNGSSVPTNGIGYNICASQDAIVPQPDKEPC